MKKAVPFTFNFLLFAGAASYVPFLVLYYQQLKFSGTQISLLAGLPPLVTLVSSPFWTNIADSTRRHKLIMSIGLVVVVGIMVAFPFLKTFALVMFIVLLFNLFAAPLISFADSATMFMLADEKEMYGRLRLGGTIGWGLAAPLAGALIKAYGLNMAFWGYAAMSFLGLIVSQGFSFGTQEGTRSRGSIRDLLSNRHWILFLALAFIGGFSFSPAVIYFSPYMKELGADEFVIGIALLVSTLSEIPVFFFGDRLLKRFKSYGLLILALAVMGTRSLLFAASGTPILAVLVQLLQGLTFPALWIAGVAYADENAPENLKSTAQGLFAAMTFGFGSAVGNLMGGILLERFGGRTLFLAYGVFVFLGVATITLIKKRTPQNV